MISVQPHMNPHKQAKSTTRARLQAFAHPETPLQQPCFPCKSVAHCATELAQGDPVYRCGYHQRCMTQSVQRRLIYAARCHKRTMQPARVQEFARLVPAPNDPCVGITQSENEWTQHGTPTPMPLRAWHHIDTAAYDPSHQLARSITLAHTQVAVRPGTPQQHPSHA